MAAQSTREKLTVLATVSFGQTNQATPHDSRIFHACYFQPNRWFNIRTCTARNIYIIARSSTTFNQVITIKI